MNYYNAISKGYSRLHGEEQQKKAAIIAGKLELCKATQQSKNLTLLDVGCGNGSYLKLFKCQVTGIDLSEKLVKQYKGKHKLMCGCAEELPFENNTFDFVISLTAIHNFNDIRKGMEEMERVGRSRFVFSILKRSSKLQEIQSLIKELFGIDEIIEEDKDIIFFAHKKI
ncbi:class I SAM-dependent methyltransferase [Candidatus Woesearchaeota archaeon]|nr:class I SAM-dependent methyltransferase [Candidatus Woesearchaeota archaeon]